MPRRNGIGMFPRAMQRRHPLLPMEEEGRLNEPPLRENFIDRIFTFTRWQKMLEQEPSPGGLVAFHTAHKLTLMAHSPAHLQETGRLVARAGTASWDEIVNTYGRHLMEGLAVLSTRGKHTNVMHHVMGFLKDQLADRDRQELVTLIEDYRQGMIPLIVPLTLLKHHILRCTVPEWLDSQVYLNPYPKELMLRNHV